MDACFRRSVDRAVWAAAVLLGTLLPLGCRGRSNSFDVSRNSAAWSAAEFSARQELASIPPPKKSAYQMVAQESDWQNPFLTVERDMIQLRIYLPDENGSDIDRGGMTRLKAARKHVLNIRLSELPRALTSLPADAWPYGHVIAIEADPVGPAYRAQLEKNSAATAAALREMGILVEGWTNGAPAP